MPSTQINRQWSYILDPQSSVPRHRRDFDPYVIDFRLLEWQAHLEGKESTHRLVRAGQLVTKSEFIEMHEMLSSDPDNPPFLMIDLEAVAALTGSAMVAGWNGYFYLNLVKRSLGSQYDLLDIIRAVCHPHRNETFGNQKLVFVERPFAADVEKRFEFLGEYIVDVSPEEQFVWQTLSPEDQFFMMQRYVADLQKFPRPPLQLVGDQFFGSLVQSFYDNSNLTPLIGLTRCPQEGYFVAEPIDSSDSSSETDSDAEADSEATGYDMKMFVDDESLSAPPAEVTSNEP
ncbi:hypothetical protein DFH06DRAFT_1158797 [Mycena polygramma]|nr:hypothetical protein DFH06DRAFT_1158797 [Mycena polygramma]